MGRAGLSPIRVLLAEDETHLGTILEQYLSARGFDVTMVRDGRAALDALRAETFDVALLDIVMPEMDGLEVLRLVREEPLPPEIIVITGNGTIETAIAALKLGAYDFLSKPYRMAEIDALVRRAWEKRMLARDNHVLQSRLRRASGVAASRDAVCAAGGGAVAGRARGAESVAGAGERRVRDREGVVARLLHERGGRPDAPFIEVDCAAMPGERCSRQNCSASSVARGQGRDTQASGMLELAAGGTLYLDDDRRR